MCDERELELLREVRRRADALDVTYVHLRKGMHVSQAADYVLVTVESYDNLREAIGGDLEGYEAEREEAKEFWKMARRGETVVLDDPREVRAHQEDGWVLMGRFPFRPS